MRTYWIARFARFLVVVPLVLAACAPPTSVNQATSSNASAPSAPSAPKNIIVINSGTPPGVDNRFVITSNNAAGIVLGLYAGKLIVADNSGGLRLARLAETVPSLENGLWTVAPDGTMETRLTLVRGALWHDGAPFTTQDILFNDDVYLDKNLPQLVITPRNYVERMEAVDDRTLLIHWNQPYIQADIFS